MKNNDEYLRLPHGMFDRNSQWVRREREILKRHDEIGRKAGCEVKKYTPLGFSETYQRGTNAANDKVYKFESKTGKSLMLSSDSTPSIFREYLASGESKSKRIAFVAPLFRYKKSNSRHFTQIGYAIINEPKDNSEIDIKIIELAKSMIELCSSMGIQINICLNDYEALKKMLSDDISREEMPEVQHKLQFYSKEERVEFFNQRIKDCNKRTQLIDLFSREPEKITEFDESENKMNLPQEYMGIYRMAKGLKTVANIDIIFDPTNLHSIETLENYALRFTTLKGVHLGDGGEYTTYAKRFDERIKTYWSVASGVEAIERNSPLIIEPQKVNKLAMFNTDASAWFVIEMIKFLEDKGYAVVYQGRTNKIGKAIKKLDEDFTHLTIIGKNEETSQELRIRELKTREEIAIKVQRQMEKNSLKTTEIGVSNQSSEVIKSIIKVMRDYFKTNDFKREDLLEIIANHCNPDGYTSLSCADIETLILEVGKVYREKGIIKDEEKEKDIKD